MTADDVAQPTASILIADDNPDGRRLLLLLLKSEGYRLLVARDGHEALRIAERTPDLALAILDVMMPGLDGFQVCRLLRAREAARPNDECGEPSQPISAGLDSSSDIRLRESVEAAASSAEALAAAGSAEALRHSSFSRSYLPIILATALNGEEHLAEGLAAGADDYVTKPLIRSEVLARVRTALRLKRATDELLAGRELAAVGAMAITLGHEINNPLTTIAGNLELALQKDDLGEKARRRLQAAYEASVRIRELVGRLVNIQRVVTTSYVGAARMLDIDHSCLATDPPTSSPPVPTPLDTQRD